MDGVRGRPAACDRDARDRRDQRGRGRVGAAPRRGVRRRAVRDRGVEARRADLEEGSALDRRRRLGDGGLAVARDLAIDLGTASVLVYRLGDGIVFDDATVVALEAGTDRVVAVGEEAWRIIGSGSGDVVGVRPLRDGTFTEFEITQRLLEVVMRRA